MQKLKQNIILTSIIAGLSGFGIGYVVKQNTGNAPLIDSEIQVCFTSPKSQRKFGFVECESVILREINRARKNIYVQAYNWTSREIAAAVIAAANRGVEVRIILDKENEAQPSDAMKMVVDAGIETKIRRISGIAHNKIMIIDESTVVTGSYNFTRSANERNEENLLVIKNKSVAQKYLKNWFDCHDRAVNIGQVVERDSKPWNRSSYVRKTKLDSQEWRAHSDARQKWDELKKSFKQVDGQTKPFNYIENMRGAKQKLYFAVNPKRLVLEDNIIRELIAAKSRGVDIKILCNKKDLDDKTRNILQNLQDNGMQVRIGSVKENIIIRDDYGVNLLHKTRTDNNSFSAFYSNETGNKAASAFLAAWDLGMNFQDYIKPTQNEQKAVNQGNKT